MSRLSYSTWFQVSSTTNIFSLFKNGRGIFVKTVHVANKDLFTIISVNTKLSDALREHAPRIPLVPKQVFTDGFWDHCPAGEERVIKYI